MKRESCEKDAEIYKMKEQIERAQVEGNPQGGIIRTSKYLQFILKLIFWSNFWQNFFIDKSKEDYDNEIKELKGKLEQAA